MRRFRGCFAVKPHPFSPRILRAGVGQARLALVSRLARLRAAPRLPIRNRQHTSSSRLSRGVRAALREETDVRLMSSARPRRTASRAMAQARTCSLAWRAAADRQ